MQRYLVGVGTRQWRHLTDGSFLRSSPAPHLQPQLAPHSSTSESVTSPPKLSFTCQAVHHREIETTAPITINAVIIPLRHTTRHDTTRTTAQLSSPPQHNYLFFLILFLWFPPLVVHFFCSLIKPPLTRFAHASDQRSGFRRDSALLGQPGAAAPELNTANLNANSANATNPSNTGIPWVDSTVNPTRLFGDSRTVQFLNSLDDHDASAQLPPFIRPLPTKIASDDVSYLQTKGALTLPSVALQNALLQAHVEFVHPYMPLMDIHPFLSIVHNRDGFNGQTSLLLYHAVMFSGVAFVDMKRLREAGYSTRKAARKAFFQKTRVCCSKKKK